MFLGLFSLLNRSFCNVNNISLSYTLLRDDGGGLGGGRRGEENAREEVGKGI